MLASPKEEAGVVLSAFLDEIVWFESYYVRREDAMELSAQMDKDWDAVLEIGMLPAEPIPCPGAIFSRKDACDAMTASRLHDENRVTHLNSPFIHR